MFPAFHGQRQAEARGLESLQGAGFHFHFVAAFEGDGQRLCLGAGPQARRREAQAQVPLDHGLEIARVGDQPVGGVAAFEAPVCVRPGPVEAGLRRALQQPLDLGGGQQGRFGAFREVMGQFLDRMTAMSRHRAAEHPREPGLDGFSVCTVALGLIAAPAQHPLAGMQAEQSQDALMVQ